MRARAIAALVFGAAVFAACFVSGCGGASPVKEINNYAQETPLTNGNPKLPFDPYALDTSMGVNIEDFCLFVVDESNQPNADYTQLYRLEKKVLGDGEVMLTVSVHGSPGIPHSLLYLRYDQEKLSPRNINLGGFFGKKSEYISFTSDTLPGVLSIGIARIHPENGMPTGDGAVATVVFDSKPFDAAEHRSVAKAATGEENRIKNLIATPTADYKVHLRWSELCVGDYDNDGEVTIADITPIALRYGNIVGDGIGDNIDMYVDGDGNKEVGISDITPIAIHYLTLISGYRIYRTSDVVGEPTFTDPYLGFQTGNVTIGRADPPPDRSRPIYEYIDGAVVPDAEYRYKVVPYDLGTQTEGVDSNIPYVLVSPSGQDVTPPVWMTSPGIIHSVPGDGVIKVTFGRAEDADTPPVGYVLYYATEPFSQAQVVNTLPGITSPFYLGSLPAHGIVNDVEYYLLVRAYDSIDANWENCNITQNAFQDQVGLGKCTPSAAAGTDIDPPVWDDIQREGIYQILSGDGQLSVFFGAATDAQTPPVSYTLYYQPGNAGVIKDEATAVPGVTSPYVVSGLTNEQVYSLLVTASDGAAIANETENTAFTLGMPTTGGSPDLTPPFWVDQVGIKSTRAGDGSVRVYWNFAKDADTPPVTYTVFWEQDDATPPLDFDAAALGGRTMSGLTGTSAVVSGLTNGIAYRFGVRAVDSAVPANSTQNTNSAVEMPAPAGDTDPPLWVSDVGITSASPRNQAVDITWGLATDLLSLPVVYNVYWEQDKGSGPIDYQAAILAGRVSAGLSGTSTSILSLQNNLTYRFGVRAEDAVGNEDTNTVSLTAKPAFMGNFAITTIDQTGDTGYTPSLAQASDGSLGIAYYDQTNGTLKYATNKSGSWVTETVYTPPVSEVHGPFPSLAYDGLDHPHIAYLDWTNSGAGSPSTRVLYVMHDGTGWTPYEVVDPGSISDYDTYFNGPRITMGPGNIPVVCYVDVTNGKVFRTAKNGSWAETQLFSSIFPAGTGGLRTEAVYFDPGIGTTIGIAWCDTDNGLSFAYYDTSQIPPQWVTEVIGGSPGVGLYLDAMLGLNGQPVISFKDAVGSRPMFARRVGADNWNVDEVDAGVTGNGFSTAVGIINSSGTDIAAVAWFDQNNLGARYAVDDLSGPGFLTPLTVDPTTAGTGFFLSMVVDNTNFNPSRACIAYTAPNGGSNAKLNLAVRIP